MGRLRKLGLRFLAHEGLAWVTTIVWLVSVAGAVAWKAAPYDPGARLDLADWSDIGTFVSAVVAPIAVLWVVRSFYVQKRELAEAVRAAGLQAAALQEQNKFLREDQARSLTPRMVIGVQSSIIEDTGHRVLGRASERAPLFREQFNFRLRNTGHGTAYEVRMSFRGVIAVGLAPWTENSEIVKEVMVTNESADHQLSRRLNPEFGQTVNLLLTITYRRMDRSLGKQFFIYNCVTGHVDETTEQRFEALVAANGFIEE